MSSPDLISAEHAHPKIFGLREQHAISAAIEKMGVILVRAFIQLRQMMVNHKALTAKLAELDARLGEHDEQIASLVEAIPNLTMPDGPTHKRRIGFNRIDN